VPLGGKYDAHVTFAFVRPGLRPQPHRSCRRYLTRRGIKVRIARRGIEGKSRLGRVRSFLVGK